MAAKNCGNPFGSSMGVRVPSTSRVYFYHGAAQMVKTSPGPAHPGAWEQGNTSPPRPEGKEKSP